MTDKTESVTLLGINVQKCDATRNGKNDVNRVGMRFRRVFDESYILSIEQRQDRVLRHTPYTQVQGNGGLCI